MSKVLVLGAGMVVRPMVAYLMERDIHVTVASRTVSKAEAIVGDHANGTARTWTVDQTDDLNEMVRESDVVVSLLPYAHHVMVAEHCLTHRRPMVTTSYLSDEMTALDERAKQQGILILNEIGLDPGIDHMSAMKTIHGVRAKGGEIVAFHSYCGALPAPEAADNPFKYKFSWSPRGVVLAGRNAGKWLEKGKTVEIAGEELFSHTIPMEVAGIGTMEVYPNRDSLAYLKLYGIENAESIFRGTFRYVGWCDTWYVISNLGLLDTNERSLAGMTYGDLLCELAGATPDTLKETIARKFDLAPDADPIAKMEWLGLFGATPIGIDKGGAIDALVELLLEKLAYKEGERDMVMLRDEVTYRLGGKVEKHISTLTDFGAIGGDTAIARTVSLPAAVAVRLILTGEITRTGVWIPTEPDLYGPVLNELETLGITSTEETVPVDE